MYAAICSEQLFYYSTVFEDTWQQQQAHYRRQETNSKEQKDEEFALLFRVETSLEIKKSKMSAWQRKEVYVER